jgi:uncharacterized repeat protein (TIGR03803 family)
MKHPLIKTIEAALFIVTGLLAMSAQAGVVFTSLYSFTGTNDGANPVAGLIQGRDGYLYGTTESEGGNVHLYVTKTGKTFFTNVFYGYGTVFKINTNGALTTLYSFGSNTNANGDTLNGGYPEAGLVQGNDGNFYGTTTLGANLGDLVEFPDTVFKIGTNGILTTLIEGIGNPLAPLIQGSDGNFYGTTSGYDPDADGNLNFEYGTGSVFQITTNGLLTYLDYFRSGFRYPGGFALQSALVQGSDGNLYGTTSLGGADFNDYDDGTAGTVFQISTNETLNILYSFTNASFIRYETINSSLMQGSDGNLYGTTEYGGTNDSGTLYRIGTNGMFTNLYSFGGHPYAGVVQGSDGGLYGTTSDGGTNNSGTVFKINPDGTRFTTLYTFSARGIVNNYYTTNSDGAIPQASLILVGNTLYGTTTYGGIYGYGTVFRLTLPVPPQLSIIADGANAILTWPADATGFNNAGFTLVWATNLVPPIAWQTNSIAPIVIGGQDVVTNPLTGSQMFFRLSQ